MPGIVYRLDAVLSWRRFVREALRTASANPADVWYAHDMDTLPAAARARRRHGGALVYDSHELFMDRVMDRPQPRIVRSWWRRAETRLIRQADRVFVPVPSRAAILANRYGIDRPTLIMNVPSYHPPPATRSGAIRERIGLGDRRMALYLGGIIPGRLAGLRMLVTSIPHLASHTHVGLMGPGDDATRAELKELAVRLGVGDRLHLLPPADPDQILEHVADADVGVVPFLNLGLNNYHSLPTKLFDYLAAGVPIAASHFPDMRELIERYDVGETFDPERPDSIASAIEAIVGDPERQARLGANAAEAAKDFTWEDQAARLLAAVDDSLKEASLGFAA
jgi:glycosyltransferase involved in cell wall biosynthesis